MVRTGGQPAKLGRCTDCRKLYPLHRVDDGWHAIGTDGSCSQCGNHEFVPLR